jgi:uncharacterized protein YqgQ
MEKLQKVLDTYARYLNSLKKEETDIKTNYSAMKSVIERDCDEWLKKHMLQDSIINSLRANRKKYDDIKPSSRIQLLMDSSDNIGRVEQSIVIPKADGEKEIRFSWLPTLYQYFNPQNMIELHSMEKELQQLHSIGLISDTDYLLVDNNVFRTRSYKFNQEEIKGLYKEELETALAE